MARWAVQASTNVDVSISAWGPLLRRCAPGVRFDVGYRPVPSNIPVVDDVGGVAAVRRQVAPGGETIIGSFSTFSDLTGPLFAVVMPRLIVARPGRVALLIGRGSRPMAARLAAAHPALEGRLRATGELPPADVSRHLQACDLMIQAYPDGVSGRRGSVMAVLAHGRPTVTNTGFLSEPLWADSGAVGLAPSCAADDLVRTAERLLADRGERDRVGAAGRDLHERQFAIERTVEALLGLPPARPS